MIMSAVADPLAFEQSCFQAAGYRQQADLFLRGLGTNGLLVVDPEGDLQRHLVSNVQALSLKQGQRLRIRLEELLKNKRTRIVRCHPDAGVIQTNDPLELAWSVSHKCEVDVLVAADNSVRELQRRDRAASHVVPLSIYSDSSNEEERDRYLRELPPIDELDLRDVEALFLRVVRFAKWLRFYDKQIGKGKNTSNFRDGIEYILALWEMHGHFASRGAAEFVEIITCQKERIRATDDQHAKDAKRERNLRARKQVEDVLVTPLRDRFPWPIDLRIKDESGTSLHPRHLQAQAVIILVDAGFDLFVPGRQPRQFKKNILKIDNGSNQHLQEYRRLPEMSL